MAKGTKKAKIGRPTKYKKRFCQSIIDYFNVDPTRATTVTYTYKDGTVKEEEKEVPNKLPTIQGFCADIGIAKPTLHDWVKLYPEFSDAYKWARGKQEQIWMTNALLGNYAQPFAIFTGKNCFGWKDKQEIETRDKTLEDRLKKLDDDAND